MLASVIVPAWNHARYLPEAIESVLAQTVPTECVVVDDGSDDATYAVLDRYAGRITTVRQKHSGVGTARNAGMRAASGDALMFLDADDVIRPQKIERQLAELDAHPEADWILCDVRIIDEASRQDELASRRYGYAKMALVGYIGHLLASRNFIPVHSPLLHRRAIGSAQFSNSPTEDWRFWQDVAEIASVRYIPDVLCEYRHRLTGRSRGK